VDREGRRMKLTIGVMGSSGGHLKTHAHTGSVVVK
jgi:hypothetical protein